MGATFRTKFHKLDNGIDCKIDLDFPANILIMRVHNRNKRVIRMKHVFYVKTHGQTLPI
jgi:hypothetical protein